MIKRKDVGEFQIEAFSQGKKAKRNRRERANEDRWIATPDYIAVIDGATANPPITINGMTSGEYASETIADILKKSPPGLSGQKLVNRITDQFRQSLQQLPEEVAQALRENPHAKPYASLAVASVTTDSTTITQVGDVGFRVNGGPIQDNPKEIDEIHARQRVEAIQRARRTNPQLSQDELLQRGADEILPSLRRQVQDLQNNPNHLLGYGVIDGQPVDPKFVKSHPPIPTEEIETLEIYSDGYFKPGGKPTVPSWEKSFREVEREDPNKIEKYPSVKGSTPDHYTDDRTILIARREKRRRKFPH